MNSVNKKLNFEETKHLANYLFPIGTVVFINIGEKKCPAIILGHLICKSGIGDSLSYLGRQELEFLTVCRLIVLRGKQKLVCCFDNKENKLQIWTTKADEYDKESWEGWECFSRRGDLLQETIAPHS